MIKAKLKSIVNELLKMTKANALEELIIKYIYDLGHKLKYETSMDSYGNVIIVKPASPNYNFAESLFLHSQVPVDYEILTDEDYDLCKQGLDTIEMDDVYYARKTSIAAHSQQGLALIIAILLDKELKHPELEIILSINSFDEESSLSQLDFSKIKSKRGINLNGYNDDEIIVSSESDFHISLSKDLELKEVNAQKINLLMSREYMIILKGLSNIIMGVEEVKLYPDYLSVGIISEDNEKTIANLEANANKWSIDKAKLTIEDCGNVKTKVYDIDQIESIYREYLEIKYGFHTELILHPNGTIEIEFMPKFDGSEIDQFNLWKLKRRIESFSSQHYYKFELLKEIPGFSYERFSALRDSLIKTSRKKFGREMKLIGLNKSSELGYFQNIDYLDLVSIASQCENEGVECIDMNSLEKTYLLLTSFLESLTKSKALDYLDLRQIINEFDPIGLIFLESPEEGAPLDEYDVETIRIMRYLHEDITAEEIIKIVDDVFDYYFNGPDLIKSVYLPEKGSLEIVADKILALYKKHQSLED